MLPNPTPYPDVNAIVEQVFERARALLGDHLTGMYLDGSLTGPDFDEDSDIDFVIVTDIEIDDALFAALQAMHDQLSLLDSPWAIQLEGSYLSQQALRRYDPRLVLHPNLERGQGERLKWAHHGPDWNVHRSVLRERGITLAGPDPRALIDPVSPADLRAAMRSVLDGWAARFLDDPQLLHSRGYQSYVVLSLCRILYTLEHGSVASKRVAAGWAREKLGPRWSGLIERAWVGRHHPDLPADPGDLAETLELIRYTR